MTLEEKVAKRVEENRNNAAPETQAEPIQSNGVKSYAKATIVGAILIAAYFAYTGALMAALYIVAIGISASALFFALGAIVDRLNDIINLLK